LRKEEYSQEAQRTISIIEEKYNVDWSNKVTLLNIKTLDLHWKNIVDISCLNELTNLTSLNLSKNEIYDISPLMNLYNLTELNLWNNNIDDISSIKTLTQLSNLILHFNNIFDISYLRYLTNLSTLNLKNNKISDIKGLTNLDHLVILDLSNNQIKDISALENLIKLKELNISSNKISDISKISKLMNLYSLNLKHNFISNIFSLKYLEGLIELYLGDNQISQISPLYNLQYLTILDLSKNNITSFSNQLLQLELSISVNFEYGGIQLNNNPIQEPPLEIIKQGNQAIQKYFDDLEAQGRGKLNEAKLIIVGEPEAGKSSLMECLLNPNYKLDPDKASTMGIDVKPWKFAHPQQNEREIRANIWDFGGQQIQYMTHQFFLTPDSLYVLVTANDRKESTNFLYWFKIIHLLSTSSKLNTN